MNSVNRSTGFSPFQLHFGHSPHLLPPLFPETQMTPASKLAHKLLECMQGFVYEAQDNLMSAKVSQALQANKCHSLIFPFRVGEHIVLSTAHCQHKFRARDLNHVAKFMPRYDGPFHIKHTDKKHFTVTLDLPNLPNVFPVFHASEVCSFTLRFAHSLKMMTHSFLPKCLSLQIPSALTINKNISLIKSLMNKNVAKRPFTMSTGKVKGQKATCDCLPKKSMTAKTWIFG